MCVPPPCMQARPHDSHFRSRRTNYRLQQSHRHRQSPNMHEKEQTNFQGLTGGKGGKIIKYDHTTCRDLLYVLLLCRQRSGWHLLLLFGMCFAHPILDDNDIPSLYPSIDPIQTLRSRGGVYRQSIHATRGHTNNVSSPRPPTDPPYPYTHTHTSAFKHMKQTSRPSSAYTVF